MVSYVHTIYIKFVRLDLDGFFNTRSPQEFVVNDVYDTASSGRELGSKVGCVHLSCLSIGFVQDILLIEAKSGLLTSFSKGR